MDKLENNKKYAESWWGRQSGIRRFFSFSERYHCHNSIKLMADCDNKVIADIGFGSGMLYDKLKSRVKKYIGYDISINNVLDFNDKISILSDSYASLINNKTSKTDASDESFDCVVCSNVIEHVPDEKSLIDEIHRILKVRGKLVLTVPINEETLDVQNHLRKYTPGYVDKILNEKFIKIYSFESDAISLLMCKFALKKGLLNQAMKKLIIVAGSLLPIPIVEVFNSVMVKSVLKNGQYVALYIKK